MNTRITRRGRGEQPGNHPGRGHHTRTRMPGRWIMTRFHELED
ncbi:hypothetical protein [Mycobacterium talmoniae]|nr:hypothetical protein [Mycobacterium talmoniae]